MEGHPERVTARGEDVAAMTIDGGPDEVVVASHCFGHLGAVRRPQPGRFLDVGEPERHGPGRSAERRGAGHAIGAELHIVAEDQRLQLAEPRAGFDPERLDEVMAGPAVGGEGVGLTAHPVERGHQQRPQALAERVGRRELGQRADHGVRIRLDAPSEVRLHRPEVLLDESVDGCGHRLGVEAGEWRAGPLGERGRRVTLADGPLEANDVDGRRRHVQAIGGSGPHDRMRSEALAQARHVRLERLVGRARRPLAPHQGDDARDGDGDAGRQGEHGEHGLALRRADVDGCAVVGRCAYTAKELNLHGTSCGLCLGRAQS